MRSLYESILDDEDEVMDRMSEVPAKQALYNIMDMYGKKFLMDQGRVKYIKDKGVYLPGIDNYNDYSMAIMNDPDIDNIYYADDLSLLYMKDSDIAKKEIHINNLKILRVNEINAEELDYKKFKIDKIETLYCYISGKASRTNWIKLINYFKPKNVYIYGNRKINREEDATAEYIKGLDVNILQISCDIFKDVIWKPNHQKFSPSEANIMILDNIFANNKFKELQIRNSNAVIRYYEVIKSPRAKQGYKFINHR